MDYIKNLLTSTTNPNELILEYYEIHISSNLRSAMNGNFRKIIEIYVPELNLTINRAISPINTFSSEKERYKYNKNIISPYPPKLIKKVKISKDSDEGKQMIWLAEFYNNKEKNEKSLVKLFDDNEDNKDNE